MMPFGFFHAGSSNGTNNSNLVVEVTSATGRIWMDRNLGAMRAATSATDYQAYGSLYQFGRGSDGHQLINWTSATAGTPVNGTTTVRSINNSPGNNLFISVIDWKNDNTYTNLWQGTSETNNPCPDGFRVPTSQEWLDERASWTSNNAAGAFASPLKLPLAGYRSYNSTLFEVGTSGRYWSTLANRFHIYVSGTGNPTPSDEGNGFSVRCIKDY
uniref:hypothetical protein n=1 Tax=Algoriphagus sp. TaxID=1872435 RepID=UPI0040473EF2